jgi:hypothetical protein
MPVQAEPTYFSCAYYSKLSRVGAVHGASSKHSEKPKTSTQISFLCMICSLCLKGSWLFPYWTEFPFGWAVTSLLILHIPNQDEDGINKEIAATLEAFLRPNEDDDGSFISKITNLDAQLITARDRMLRTSPWLWGLRVCLVQKEKPDDELVITL